FAMRVVKATLFTAVSGIFWLILWFLTSMILKDLPQYLELFAVLAWGLIFFTFAITFSEGTIYKYILIIIRAFFLIVYLAYSTNCGVFTVTFENVSFTVEFVPLLAVMIVASLLSMIRGILQAIEFAAQTPKD
ncbi:MAG: hypothetical protein QXJ94_01835, partial [Candidatus Bathyarchaeia archaeon]